MGLSSWIQTVWDRAASRRRRSRCAQDDFVQLFLTRLEDRRVLNAAFSLVGTDSLLLNGFTQTGDENLTIQDNGTNYEFVLAEGLWNGTDGGGVTGTGSNTLSVDKALINNAIQIDDSAAIDVDISFGTSDFTGLGSLQIDGAGAISQIAASTLQVSTFDVDAASLTLDEASNDFGSITLNVTGAAALRDANDLTLGSITTGDALQVTTAGVLTLTGDMNTDGTLLTGDAPIGTAGSITITGNVAIGADVAIDTDAGTDGVLTVNGSINGDGQSLTLELGSTDLSLTDPANDFGTLSLTAGNATIVDADDLALGASTLTGDFSVTAGGAITEAATPGMIASGGNLMFSANGNLGASGAALDIRVGGTASLTAAGSDVYITSDQNLVISHLETAAAQADAVEITTTAGANLTLQVVTADYVNLGTDDITLNAAGSLTLQGDPLTAGTLNLTGADVAVNTNLLASTGAVFITANGAGGNVVMQDGTTVSTTNANITVQSMNNVQLSRLMAGGTNTVSITAGGTITDANTTNEGAGNENIVAEIVSLQAANGIGASGTPMLGDGEDIDINAGTLTAINTTTGAIQIFEVDDIALDQLANPGRTVIIEAAGTLTVQTNPLTAGTVTLTGADVAINADVLGTTGAIVITASAGDVAMQDGTTVSTTNANITIQATNDVQLSQVIDGGLNTVSITAGNAITDANSTNEGAGNENIIADIIILQAATGIGDGEDIDINGGTLTATNTTSGAIQIFEVDDIALDQVSNPGGTVLIEAGGAITDANSTNEGAGNENIIADIIILQAVTGIGDGEDIDINGGTLTATNTTSGAIQIFEVDDIALNQITNPGRAVIIEAGGTLTVQTNPLTAGTITLTGADVAVNADVEATAGAIVITASAGDVLMQDGTLVSTINANITIQATNDVQLSQVIDGGLNTVSITAGNAITDANPANEGAGNENIIADIIILQAVNGIGASGTPMIGNGEDIDINGGTLTANNTTSGAIQIFEVDDIALDQVSNPGGTVLIEAGGAINDSTPGDDSTANIIAGQAGVRAGSGVGAGVAGDGADLDTAVGTLAAVTNTGDINIDAAAALIVGTVGGLNGFAITNSDAVASGNDDITVLAAGTLTVNSAITNTDGGDVVLTAESGGDLLINANVQVNAPGNITLTGQNVRLSNAIVQIIGTGTITATTPQNGPVAGTGIITVNAAEAAETSIDANSTLRTGGGVIQITTDDLIIDPAGLINAIDADVSNGGVVMIRNATAGRNIELGGSVGGAVLNISDGELDRIAADSLRIGLLDGVNDAGNVTITAMFSATLVSTVQLFAAGNVTQNAGTGFIAGEIGIVTGDTGAVNLGDAANDANLLAINSRGSVLFNDADSLTIGRITDAVDDALPADGEAGISGVTSTTSFVDLQAQGALTVQDIAGVDPEISATGRNSANNLAINLFSAGTSSAITIDAGANVSSTAGSHRYTADNMDLQGTISASPTDFSVSLRNSAADVVINLGSAGANAANNMLELSAAELDNITTNLLAIGRNTGNGSGNITITQTITPASPDTLHLITPGTITDDGGAVVIANLFLESGAGVMLDNIAANDVDTLAALISGTGAGLTFMDQDNITVGTVNRLTVVNDADEAVGLAAQSGINTNGGDVQIVSGGGGVVVSQTIETTSTVLGQNSGSITIAAQDTGGIQINAALITTGIASAPNGAGGDITLTTNNGDIEINAAALNAEGGGAVDGGNITLDANGANADVLIRGTLTTNDIDDGTVRGSVNITAGDAATIGANITTTGLGAVMITANDSNADGDNNGALTMNAGTIITAADGDVTLQTLADASDEATIIVQQITAADGDVLIDANGANADVILMDQITTGGGSVNITADDAVTIGANITTTGLGTVTITANDSNLDGDGDGALTMNSGTIITAADADVTLQTVADASDEAAIIVQQITTAGGDVVIDANGANADVILASVITTGDGAVRVLADDTVSLQSSAMIMAAGMGDVLLRANQDGLEGNSGDQLFMLNGSVVNAGTGTATLRTDGAFGGRITLSRVVTQNQNTMADAVTIISQTDVVDAGDTGGADIEATANAASTINITSATGVGTLLNAIETSGVRFNINNTGVGVINIANVTDSLDVVIERLTTTGQLISFSNADLDNIAPGSLTIASAGVASLSNGGAANDIIITTAGELNLAAPISTQGGTGGTFTVNGGITFTPAASILLGTGDITLNTGTGGLDIVVDSDLTIAGPIVFNAPRDIIINAMLSNTAGDIVLSADSDLDGVGGVVVRTAGQVDSAGNLTMEGSNVFAATPVDIGIMDAVHIEEDGGNVQAQAGGDLIIRNRASANLAADIVLAGDIASTGGTILITANNGNLTPVAGNQIHLAGDTTLTATGDIAFAASVVDDGDSTTTSKLTVNTTGAGRFLGGIGVGGNSIGSLLTNAGGTTEILGGLVSTVGNQTYGDAVRIDNQINAASTTIAAGGNVLFQSTVDGLNPGSADDLILNVTGTTTFNGVVGGTERIGDGAGIALGISSVDETIFNAQVNTQAGLFQTDAAGRITFREDVDIDGNIASSFNADVTLDGVTISSDGDLIFGNAAGDDLRIDVFSALNTSAQSRNITINSNVSDPGGSNEDFTLDLNGGDLTFNGSLGAAGNRLGDIEVIRANGFVLASGQNIFAESLTQGTGVDVSGQAATTTLNGTINTSGAGVTLASTNIIFNGDVTVLNLGDVLTQAAGNITYFPASSTTAQGGRVVSDAGGQLFMAEASSQVATIDANGGIVVLRAGGNLTVSQIRTAGGYVGLISTNGGVIDGGNLPGFGADPIGTHDVQAAQLQIVAQAGIGAAGDLTLETMVSNLEASNGSNGILIANTGALTIGGVGGVSVETFRNGSPAAIALPSRNGVLNTGGDINIAALGDLTVAENVISQGAPGNITLTAESAASDFQALNGTTIGTNRGNISIAAGANLMLSGLTATTNQGNINLFATNNALLDNTSATTAASGSIGLMAGNDATVTGRVQTANGSIGVEAGGDFQSIFATRIITGQGVISIAAGADVMLAGLTTTTSQGNINVFAGNDAVLNNTSITAATAGTISVMSGGDASFTGRAQAVNGSVLVNAGGDFLLMDNTPAAPELQVVGGQVIVVAQGSVQFMPLPGGTELPLVQSSTGSVRLPTPVLANIFTPQINTEGEARLTFTVGVPGESNLTAIIDWGDGTTTVQGGLLGGQTYTIFHTYDGTPNLSNPGADIRVFLVVANDQNIHLFGNNHSLLDPSLSPLQPPPDPPLPQVGLVRGIDFLSPPNSAPLLTVNDLVLQALNPANPLVPGPLPDFLDNLGVTSIVVAFPVPVSGFGSMAFMVFDERLETFLPGATAEPIPIESSDPVNETSDFEFSGSETEDNREGEVQVLLRVLGPDGQKLFDQPIDAKYLQDPAPLWMKLPDGRYQIIVIEPGQTVGIVVRDVELKQHRVIRRFDRFRPAPNTQSSPTEQPDADSPVPPMMETPPAEQAPDPRGADTEPEPAPTDENQADHFWENWGPSKGISRFAQAEPREEAASESASAAAALAGGVALGMFQSRSRPDADSQMMRFTGRSMSPAARLRRRLRK